MCTQLNMGVSLSFTSRLAYFNMPSEIAQNQNELAMDINTLVH